MHASTPPDVWLQREIRQQCYRACRQERAEAKEATREKISGTVSKPGVRLAQKPEGGSKLAAAAQGSATNRAQGGHRAIPCTTLGSPGRRTRSAQSAAAAARHRKARKRGGRGTGPPAEEEDAAAWPTHAYSGAGTAKWCSERELERVLRSGRVKNKWEGRQPVCSDVRRRHLAWNHNTICIMEDCRK